MDLIERKKVDFSTGFELIKDKSYFLALSFFLNKLISKPDREDLIIIYENVGFCQMMLKNYKEALKHFELMKQIDSINSRCWYYLGELFYAQDKFKEAIPNYEKALTVKGQPQTESLIMYRLAYSYYFSEDFDSAEKYAQKLLKLNPKDTNFLNLMGNIFYSRLDFEEAIKYYKKVYELDNKLVQVNQNLANSHFLMRNLSKAEYYNTRMLKSNVKNEVPVAFNLAQISLLREDYKNGWKQFESRFENTLPEKMKIELAKMLSTTKMWDGSSLKDKSLLIISEQGYGDSLQFARFIPFIPKDNTRIVFSCQPGLERLIKNVPGIDDIITADVGTSPSPETLNTEEKFDYCVILMSLPYLLGVDSKEKIPNDPYLKVNWIDKEVWESRLHRGYNVGLVFAGEQSIFFNKRMMDKRRSMKLSEFDRFFKMPGFNWYNLTLTKDRPDLKEQVSEYPRFIDFTSDFSSFHDTACLISNLDLVVGVDTSTIHLAGALGKETIMFNRFDGCWRWGLKGESTVWYPNMTILRQPEFLNWEPCLNRLHEILRSKRVFA